MSYIAIHQFMDVLGILNAAQSGTLSKLSFGYLRKGNAITIPSRQFIIVFPESVIMGNTSTTPFGITAAICVSGGSVVFWSGNVNFTGTVIRAYDMNTGFAYLT